MTLTLILRTQGLFRMAYQKMIKEKCIANLTTNSDLTISNDKTSTNSSKANLTSKPDLTKDNDKSSIHSSNASLTNNSDLTKSNDIDSKITKINDTDEDFIPVKNKKHKKKKFSKAADSDKISRPNSPQSSVFEDNDNVIEMESVNEKSIVSEITSSEVKTPKKPKPITVDNLHINAIKLTSAT